ISPPEITQLIAARPSGKYVLLCIQDLAAKPSVFLQNLAPGLIEVFVANLAAFVNNYGYDGVDIDWEINTSPPQLVQLLSGLRASLPGKLITVDMNNSGAAVQAAAGSQALVDRFNIMCYDMDAPGNGYSWYNGALFQSGNSSVMTC